MWLEWWELLCCRSVWSHWKLNKLERWETNAQITVRWNQEKSKNWKYGRKMLWGPIFFVSIIIVCFKQLYVYTLRKLSSDPLAMNSIMIIHGRSAIDMILYILHILHVFSQFEYLLLVKTGHSHLVTTPSSLMTFGQLNWPITDASIRKSLSLLAVASFYMKI